VNKNESRLSFILVTTGRSTVYRMVYSITEQMREHDEILIVGSEETLATVRAKIWANPYYASRNQTHWVTCERGNNWGNRERNHVLDGDFAQGHYLVWADDDDAFLPGAVGVIHQAAAKYWLQPLMFRMVNENGIVLWKYRQLIQGNQGTPQFVAPNIPDLLGRFSERYEADFDFAVSTMAKYPNGEKDLRWLDNIIYGCRVFGNLPNPKEFTLGGR